MTAPAQAPPGAAGGRLSALLHNKPVMIGAAGAVGLGLYTAYKRKKAGASNGADSSGAVYGTPANPAQLSTVGTDVAGQLSQFGAAQSADLNQWLNGLTTTLQAGKGIPTEGTSGGGATPPAVAPASTPGVAVYIAGQSGSLYDWADRNVRAPHSGAGDALNMLRALNPQLTRSGVIQWAPALPNDPYHAKIPTLPTTMTLNV